LQKIFTELKYAPTNWDGEECIPLAESFTRGEESNLYGVSNIEGKANESFSPEAKNYELFYSVKKKKSPAPVRQLM
jgi:hypothetical protein